MNTLERLRELNTTTGKRSADEDLGHWADREKHENMWVRDEALPDLLAVVEAAKWMRKYKVTLDTVALIGIDYNRTFDAYTSAASDLDAALAKLTEAPHD